jgi:hypothetical protein
MELEQNQIVQLFEASECLDDILMVKIEDPWTDEVSALFLKHCREAQAATGVEDATAETYCSWALDKVREIIPYPHHVIALSEEELVEILKQCRPGG